MSYQAINSDSQSETFQEQASQESIQSQTQDGSRTDHWPDQINLQCGTLQEQAGLGQNETANPKDTKNQACLDRSDPYCKTFPKLVLSESI